MLLGELTALGMVDKPEVHSVCKGSGSYSKIPLCSHLAGKLNQVDHLSPGVQGQAGQAVRLS